MAPGLRRVTRLKVERAGSVLHRSREESAFAPSWSAAWARPARVGATETSVKKVVSRFASSSSRSLTTRWPHGSVALELHPSRTERLFAGSALAVKYIHPASKPASRDAPPVIASVTKVQTLA